LPEQVTAVINAGPLPETPRNLPGTMPEQPAAKSSAPAPEVDIENLPEEGINLKEHLANLEYMLIKQALDEAEGVVAHAAQRLKMRRTTLVEKMRKYGIQREVD
jgi:sigma-54 specific flagellar transcriptional regulator A